MLDVVSEKITYALIKFIVQIVGYDEVIFPELDVDGVFEVKMYKRAVRQL
jgi:hypothetical protein